MNSVHNDVLVSFILISYNQEKYIEKALLSVLNQDYNNIQIIVSDDASNDNTKSIIRKYNANNEFIFLDSDINRGLIGNLNYAFTFAQGEYIVVMSGDDISETNRVSTIVDTFIKNPDVSCIYSNTKDINLDGEKIENSQYGYRYHIKNKKINIKKHLLNDLGILGCSAAYKKCLIEKPLPQFLPSEDKVLTLRALLNGNIFFINKKLVSYRLGSGVSNNLNKKSISEYMKIIEGRLKTIEGYILELENTSDKRYISILITQRKFLTSALDIIKNKKKSLPDSFFSLTEISNRDRLRFLLYRYFIKNM